MVPEKQLIQIHYTIGNYRMKQEELRRLHGNYSATSCTNMPLGLH
jgi:hypothetical protein